MGKLLIDQTKLIYHLDTLNKWQKNIPFYPIHLDISPSQNCNHGCIFCLVDYKKREPVNLREDIFLKLIKGISELGVKSVLLAGDGEPLLNKATPKAIVLAKETGIDIALNTNGALYTREIAEKTLGSLSWIRFSVAAAEPEKYNEIHKTAAGEFEKVKRNIETAVKIKKQNKYKVTLGVQMILIPQNLDQIIPLAKLCKQLGVDYFTVKRFASHKNNKFDVPVNLYKECMEDLKDAEKLSDSGFKVIVRWNNFLDNGGRTYDKCLGLPFLAYILADGGVYTCCNFYGNDKFCYGNLYKHDFKTIWDGSLRKEVQKFVENRIDIKNCMSFCRHHTINSFLWKLKDRPAHVNYI